ncbi:hypothetical protein ACFQGT_05060 [Natrialbaceae archaeon GCM10025810]|uniref:DUF7504 family protein n=1 Tax=Halovalidus salilacus TaxID=3075124 RepID=UPI0036129572
MASKHASFAQTLGDLKRDGSNILVVGTAATAAHGAACDRLLGEENGGGRYRIEVTTADAGGDRGRDHGRSGDGITRRTITYDPHRAGADRGEVDPLSALGADVIETIDRFEAEADGLGPSELRLCVDSLVPLLQERRSEKVFRAVHVLTSRVRRVNGMAHYHLPLRPDHDAVRLFGPLFDATVELRTREGRAEQRWHLREQATPTDWHPV